MILLNTRIARMAKLLDLMNVGTNTKGYNSERRRFSARDRI